MKKGFTLIELLVVVLIVGILAAVAIPFYLTSVEKARATEAVTNLKALKTSRDVYALAHNGTFSTKLSAYSISVASSTPYFNFEILSNGNPHAWRKPNRDLVLAFYYRDYKGSGPSTPEDLEGYYCLSRTSRYQDVCVALGGEEMNASQYCGTTAYKCFKLGN